VGSLALAIVLFDSGYGTPRAAFRLAAGPAMTMATIGVFITTGLFGAAATVILNISWLEGMLLGAIVASTDAAAVFFLLRIGGVNIRDKVRSTLEVESGSNDPMAIFLTITLVDIIANHGGMADSGWMTIMASFATQLGLGLFFGIAGGALIVLVGNRFGQDQSLIPIFVLMLAMLVFSTTGAAGGSGFLAVYVAGIYAGNRKMQASQSVKRFQEAMTWLAQIIMFLMLGLLATPSQFPVLILPAIGLAFFLIFIARPLAVWLCLLPFDFSQRETTFMAWVGLRGAVSILLGILPVLGNLENGMMFFNIAFIIVLVSLLVQGWTINPMARFLGLIVPKRIGPVSKVGIDLPGTANHELVSYKVVKDSPVLAGERIPRWARPSLVIRDGKSMRYQYAGRLKEKDILYLFVSPGYISLLDRLFASPRPVEDDDPEFFGAFEISPARSARELDLAYGPGLLNEKEKRLSVGDLMNARLGGHADYADRVRIGYLTLIVRDIGANGMITSVGLSFEQDQRATTLPLFLNLHDMIEEWRKRFQRLKK
jgi:cell volume regulation protein A